MTESLRLTIPVVIVIHPNLAHLCRSDCKCNYVASLAPSSLNNHIIQKSGNMPVVSSDGGTSLDQTDLHLTDSCTLKLPINHILM